MRLPPLLLALSLLLAGESFHPALARDVTEGVATEQGNLPIDPGTEPSKKGTASGATTTTQTCTGSCNRSYEACMDQQSAVPGNGDTLRYSNNFADKLIGASSDCADHLRTCLNGCGG